MRADTGQDTEKNTFIVKRISNSNLGKPKIMLFFFEINQSEIMEKSEERHRLRKKQQKIIVPANIY